jgi:hypothetical protein
MTQKNSHSICASEYQEDDEVYCGAESGCVTANGTMVFIVVPECLLTSSCILHSF